MPTEISFGPFTVVGTSSLFGETILKTKEFGNIQAARNTASRDWSELLKTVELPATFMLERASSVSEPRTPFGAPGVRVRRANGSVMHTPKLVRIDVDGPQPD